MTSQSLVIMIAKGPKPCPLNLDRVFCAVSFMTRCKVGRPRSTSIALVGQLLIAPVIPTLASLCMLSSTFLRWLDPFCLSMVSNHTWVWASRSWCTSSAVFVGYIPMIYLLTFWTPSWPSWRGRRSPCVPVSSEFIIKCYSYKIFLLCLNLDFLSPVCDGFHSRELKPPGENHCSCFLCVELYSSIFALITCVFSVFSVRCRTVCF